MNDLENNESPALIARDVAAVGRIAAVTSILDVICTNTGMRFSAVARVSDRTWTACAVQDRLDLGLAPGGQLELRSTLCMESRAARMPIVIDQVSTDPVYAHHHTPRIYNLESYISVPIVLPDGEYFGNLCALDSEPRTVSSSHTVAMFKAFAELIALHLHNERIREAEQRRANERLAQEMAVSELREQFIAVLGHDLRSPLSAINSYAQLLLLRPQEPLGHAAGRHILASVKRMTGLVDDVMDFARGRMGTGIVLNLKPEDSLGAAIESVVTEFRATYPERPILLDMSGAMPRVSCDLPRVQQLVANLVGNALAYGDKAEPVRVNASCDSTHLRIGVWNAGPAIAHDARAKMFDPYWRAADHSSGGGLGLGLYICSQIVAAHRGTITVTSQESSGTSFDVRLPLDCIESPAV